MTAPLHALSSETLGTKLLFARWPDGDPGVDEMVRQFVTHRAKYFVCWTGSDGVFYGLARVRISVS